MDRLRLVFLIQNLCNLFHFVAEFCDDGEIDTSNLMQQQAMFCYLKPPYLFDIVLATKVFCLLTEKSSLHVNTNFRKGIRKRCFCCKGLRKIFVHVSWA